MEQLFCRNVLFAANIYDKKNTSIFISIFETNPQIANKRTGKVKNSKLYMLISLYEKSFRKLRLQSYTLI